MGNPVNIYHEIIVLQHTIDPRLMNGIAERAVRRKKEGTSAVLLQSGLDEKWWADSMECCCYLRNIQDLLSDGKTPYGKRFGKPLKRPIVPFGSLVEYYLVKPFERFGSSLQMGKHLMKGDLENHLMAR